MHDEYALNGTKVRVPNAADADVFLVWANLTNVNLESDEYADRVRCAFVSKFLSVKHEKELGTVLHNVMIVERTPENADKIKILERNDTSGLPGIECECFTNLNRIALSCLAQSTQCNSIAFCSTRRTCSANRWALASRSACNYSRAAAFRWAQLLSERADAC